MWFISRMAKLVKGMRGYIAIVAVVVFVLAGVLAANEEFAPLLSAGKGDVLEQPEASSLCPR